MIQPYQLIILAIGFALQITFILVEKEGHYKSAALLKGLAAGMFVALGFHGVGHTENLSYTYFISYGLFWGAVGDIMHAARFVYKEYEKVCFLGGAAFFLVGHFIYIGALLPYSQRPALLGLLAVGIAALTDVLLCRLLKPRDKVYTFFGAFYVLTVTLLAVFGVGTALAQERNRKFSLFALGAVLFLASDLLLIINSFGKKQAKPRVVSLILYYLAQSAIALSNNL